MPNCFKYSTTQQSLALKKGNFWIGTGDVGKGPTSTTDFWNGVTPPSGGYTIYLSKVSNGPVIYTAANDAQLISLTNSIAGQSYTTKDQCLSWFAGQSDKIVVNRDYGSYITDGLQMHIDAAYIPSYPQTGTNLLNLTYWSTVGGLYNGVSWGDYGVGGSFLLDGVDDAITLNYSSTDFRYLNEPFSLCIWANKTQTNPNGPLITRGVFGGGGYWSMGFNNGTQFSFFASRNNAGSQQLSTTNLISNNTWYYLVATFDQQNASAKLYCNGVDVTGSPVTMQIPNENAYPVCYNLGLYNCLSGGYKEFFKGYIAMHSSYNKVLSPAEVLQNYNATKSRFGL